MSICKHCKVKDICHNHIKCGKWCDGYVDTKSFYDYNIGEKIYCAGLMGKYFTVCTGIIERYEMSSKHPFILYQQEVIKKYIETQGQKDKKGSEQCGKQSI